MSPRNRIAAGWLIALAATALLPGCGETQVAPANRRIVESLATAVSAKDPKWLDENAKLIDEQRAAGRLSGAEGRAFAAILAKAKAGDWADAEALAFALRDGQRASNEDVAAATKPKLREPRRYDGAKAAKAKARP